MRVSFSPGSGSITMVVLRTTTRTPPFRPSHPETVKRIEASSRPTRPQRWS